MVYGLKCASFAPIIIYCADLVVTAPYTCNVFTSYRTRFFQYSKKHQLELNNVHIYVCMHDDHAYPITTSCTNIALEVATNIIYMQACIARDATIMKYK